MATENIVSKVYRVLTDVSLRVWDKISFWCLAKDVELANGKNLETTCGSITGITSSLTSTSKTMAASASAIKQLNDKIADLNSNLTNLKVLSSGSSGISQNMYKEVPFTIDVNVKSGILVVATGSSNENTDITGITLSSGTFEELSHVEDNQTKTVAVCVMKIYHVKNIVSGSTLTINGTNALYNGLYAILG